MSAVAGAVRGRPCASRPRTRVARPIAGRNDIRVTWPRRETDRSRSIRHRLRPRRPGARSGHRRHHHAHLPDLDLRAGGTGPAQGLRVRPHAEPDAHGARGQRRGHRGRPRRLRLRLGDGGHRRRAHPVAVGRPRGGQRQHLRRHLPAVRTGAAQVRPRLHLRRHLAARDHRPGLHRPDEISLHRVADQPDAVGDRHRRGQRDRARATASASSSTTPSPAPTCSGR